MTSAMPVINLIPRRNPVTGQGCPSGRKRQTTFHIDEKPFATALSPEFNANARDNSRSPRPTRSILREMSGRRLHKHETEQLSAKITGDTSRSPRRVYYEQESSAADRAPAGRSVFQLLLQRGSQVLVIEMSN